MSAKKYQDLEGERPRWNLLQTAHGLCTPAVSGGSAHLQAEPGTGERSCTVEDFLCCSSATPQETQPLQACGPDALPDYSGVCCWGVRVGGWRRCTDINRKRVEKLEQS